MATIPRTVTAAAGVPAIISDATYFTVFGLASGNEYSPVQLGRPEPAVRDKTIHDKISLQKGTRVRLEIGKKKFRTGPLPGQVFNELLVVKDKKSHGLWLPWLGGQGKGQASLGSYTAAIPVPPDQVDFVVTGPFSGCYAAMFETEKGVHFAHIVTGANCPKWDEQRDAIVEAIGGKSCLRRVEWEQITGRSIVFWWYAPNPRGVGGQWKRQIVSVDGDNAIGPIRTKSAVTDA